MKRYTFEQMQQAEKLALEIHSEGETPLDVLTGLALSLLCVDQGTAQPQYTEKEFEDAGSFLLAHYPLSPDFPFTNSQIAEYILMLKRQRPQPPV